MTNPATELNPRTMYQAFLNKATHSDYPDIASTWTKFIGSDLNEIAAQFGCIVRGERMNFDMLWFKKEEVPRQLALALEYEDDSDKPKEIVDEVCKKLLYIGSKLKCGIGWWSKDTRWDPLDEIEKLINDARSRGIPGEATNPEWLG